MPQMKRKTAQQKYGKVYRRKIRTKGKVYRKKMPKEQKIPDWMKPDSPKQQELYRRWLEGEGMLLKGGGGIKGK